MKNDSVIKLRNNHVLTTSDLEVKFSATHDVAVGNTIVVKVSALRNKIYIGSYVFYIFSSDDIVAVVD